MQNARNVDAYGGLEPLHYVQYFSAGVTKNDLAKLVTKRFSVRFTGPSDFGKWETSLSFPQTLGFLETTKAESYSFPQPWHPTTDGTATPRGACGSVVAVLPLIMSNSFDQRGRDNPSLKIAKRAGPPPSYVDHSGPTSTPHTPSEVTP